VPKSTVEYWFFIKTTVEFRRTAATLLLHRSMSRLDTSVSALVLLVAATATRSSAAAPAAQCTIIEGFDLTGNDLLGPNGKVGPATTCPASCCTLRCPPPLLPLTRRAVNPAGAAALPGRPGRLLRHVREQARGQGAEGQVRRLVVQPRQQDLLDEDEELDAPQPQW